MFLKFRTIILQNYIPLPAKAKPVGIDIRETDTALEAWVCNYVGGNLVHLSAFQKKMAGEKQ